MRWMIGLLALSACLATTAKAQQQAPVLAVFSIENRGTELTELELSSLSDYLSTKLGERGLFQIVPRSEIRKRIADTKTESYKECYDEACQVELGRELAAEQSLSTSISKVGSQCLLQANLFDLRRAAAVRSASAKRPCEADALVSGVEELAAKLDGSFQEPGTAATTPAPVPKVKVEPRPEVTPKPVLRYRAPPREKHVWAALAWSLLPGGGLYYTDHWVWGITYSALLVAGITAGSVIAVEGGAEDVALPVLYASAALWGVSMVHASLAALVWEDPDYVAAVRDFGPVVPGERARGGTALVLPIWLARF